MTDNPNARGWRSGWKFVDLDAVQAAQVIEGTLQIHLSSPSHRAVGQVVMQLFTCEVSPDEAGDFFNKLEIYRSQR